MYKVDFSTQATKFIRKLPEDIKDRIKKKFAEVSLDPFRYLGHFEGDYYKLRIGDYRLLMDIDFEKKLLLVRIFDKRGRIYK